MSEKAEQEEFKSPEPKKKKIKKTKVDRVNEDQRLRTDMKAFELLLSKSTTADVKHEKEDEIKHDDSDDLSQSETNNHCSTERVDLASVPSDGSFSVDTFPDTMTVC